MAALVQTPAPHWSLQRFRLLMLQYETSVLRSRWEWWAALGFPIFLTLLKHTLQPQVTATSDGEHFNQI